MNHQIPPAPDYAAVFDDLTRFHKERLFTVAALPFGGGVPACQTYTRADKAAYLSWVSDFPEHDLCHMLNEPRARLGKKPSEKDVENVWYIVVDLDPRAMEKPDEERAKMLRLATTERPAAIPAPTRIERANGYKLYWQLAEPINISGDPAKAADAKLHAIALQNIFNEHMNGAADSTQSVDHVFRCGGIVCRKPDRAPVQVEIVEDHLDDPAYVYSAANLPKAAAVVAAPPAPGLMPVAPADETTWKRYAKVEDIPVSPQMQHIIGTLSDPLDPQRFSPSSFSEAQHTATLAMAGAGMSYEQIAGVLSDEKFAVHKAIKFTHGGTRARPNWKSYQHKQIESAMRKVGESRAKGDTQARDDGNRAAGWHTDENGNIVKESQHNIEVAVGKMEAALKHDVFANRTLLVRNGHEELLNDKRWTNLWLEIDRRYKFRPSKEFFAAVVFDLAWRNSYHPVKDYLGSLQWDGVARIDKWLTTYGGADLTPYSQAVGRITLIAAVRRIYEPGCKFDEMLILESSAQGKNKSTALAILAMKPEWFNDTLPLSSDINRKVEAMQGKWIVEAGELSGMSEAGVGKLKSFLSSRRDMTRLAWEKTPDEYPRQCVIIGTTNETVDVFKDETGNRRYWPVKVRHFDDKALLRDRDQIWAEAVHCSAQGESIRLDPTLYEAAGVEQEARREVSPIEQKLSPLFGPHCADGKMPTDKVWDVLEVHSVEGKQRLGAAVGKIMKKLGWSRKQFGSEKNYYYFRNGDNDLFPPGE